MRWFKHFSDNHRGQGIQALLYEKGHTGVCVYYFLMELCADKMEKYEDGSWPTKFRFSRSILRSILKINRTNLQHILDYCQTLGLLKLGHCDDHFVEIEMPILLKLLDRDFKKTRQVRAQNALKSRLDIEEDIEVDVEVDAGATTTTTNPSFAKDTNASQLFEDSFNEETIKIKEFLAKNKLTGLVRLSAKIKNLYETKDCFVEAVNSIANSKTCKEMDDATARRYVSVAIKRELGILQDPGNKNPSMLVQT